MTQTELDYRFLAAEEASTSQSEQRSALRIRRNEHARVADMYGSYLGSGRIIDISKGGLGVIFKKALEVDDVYRVSLHLSHGGVPSIVVAQMKLVYCLERAAGHAFQLGFELLRLQEL